MSPSDRELMLRVQAGEHSMFAELVDRFRPRLLRFANSKLGDRSLAEDVVQETFLAVFVSREKYNPAFAFSTWIWTILLNLCSKAARSPRESRWRQMKSGSGEALANHPAPVPSSSAGPQESEDREELQRWLQDLPDVEADALRLRFFGGLSFDEIAAAMESSVSGAKVRVRRGLERLSALVRTADHSGLAGSLQNPASNRDVPPGGDS